MPTITVTVVEHAATDRKPWRVTAHDGTHRFTMPVIVGQNMADTWDHVIAGMVAAVREVAEPGELRLGEWSAHFTGHTKGGHRRYRVTY